MPAIMLAFFIGGKMNFITKLFNFLFKLPKVNKEQKQIVNVELINKDTEENNMSAKDGVETLPDGYLTKNFTRDEIKCPCCGYDKINIELIKELQRLRDYIQKATGKEHVFNITSACRCILHNSHIGGVSNSRHSDPYYDAVDVIVSGLSAETVKYYACQMPGSKFLSGGIGLYHKYPTMIHLDIRDKKARWIY